MESNEIRRAFLDFFESKGHVIVPSAPMVVKGDPTLMFTNAGMNQFKDIFLGNAPRKYPRAADTQKCLRVSGKHNDLEEVGHDTYHHTMFEMLGNWSYGDYFKKEAIEWAWELLGGVYKLPADRMYATVFEGSEEDGVPFDQEAYDYWKQFLPEDHIIRGNKHDNFWEMGETGPCGPCSEIHFDLRDEAEIAARPGREMVNAGHPQVIEIWNLVFMQFNRKANGSLEPLPARNVDTGMGFERLCMILQGKKSNYDTDVFQPTICRIAALSGKRYGQDEKCDVAMRVMADHLRAIAFSIADGQLPSNVKAGYVIRRILRRAVRYGYTYLGFTEPTICKLVPGLVEQMGEQFPELKAQQSLIEKVIEEEEASFLRTLATGINLLDGVIEKTKGEGRELISGKDAFELYDTFGFPIDLTLEVLEEQGMTTSREEFDRLMNEQRERAREDRKKMGDLGWQSEDLGLDKSIKTAFDGYTTLEESAKILAIVNEGEVSGAAAKGEKITVVLDRTPFYAEAGGQLADQGEILSDDGAVLEVDDVQKPIKDLIVHQCRLTEGTLVVGAEVNANIDLARRGAIARSHTATHMVHKALREELGPQATQRGSEDAPNRLRFDFQWSKAPAKSVISAVEERVNDKLRDNLAVTTKEMKFDDAIALGAMHLFGEKYGDIVRVVSIGEDGWSRELCGGTHVDHVGKIGMVNILSEASIGSGVRRVDAVVGQGAYDFNAREHALVSQLSDKLNARPDELAERVNALLAKLKESDRRLASMYESQLAASVPALVADTKNSAAPVKVAVKNVGHFGAVDALRKTVLDVRAQLGEDAPVVVALAGVNEDDKPMVAVATNEAARKAGIKAGDLVRGAAKVLGGGGGGKPDFAQGGGVDASKIDEALEALKHEAQKA